MAIKNGKLLKRLIIAAIALQLAVAFFFASVFLFHDALNFTSSNSALYLLKDNKGKFHIKRDLPSGHAESLVFELNLNRIFDYYMRGFAKAAGRPMLELTWDEEDGSGVIKQFRADGKILLVTFSRFMDMGEPHGLFIGGDLSYADTQRDAARATSGMAYYDGEKWSHIWCSANEGFMLKGSEEVLSPVKWKYTGSKKLMDSYDDVSVESLHEGEINGIKILMTRTVLFRANDDYMLMEVSFTNRNPGGLEYFYSYGDEPWVGAFGNSAGDVGWHDKGLVSTETVLDPRETKYAGYWDRGSVLAGEGRGYSGYANFIEWIAPTPSYVYLSNGFSCCDFNEPLKSEKDRVINVVWADVHLPPEGSVAHTFAVGMAKINRFGYPSAPAVTVGSR